jgi:PAS domain S-box-containing protein
MDDTKTLRELTNELLAKQDDNKLLAELIDLSPAAITVHDYEGKFIYANEKTLELHGYTKEEFLAINLHDLDLPQDEALIEQRVQRVKEIGEDSFQVEHYKKDGSILYLDVRVKTTKWSDQDVLLSIGTDISPYKLIEKYKDMSREILKVLNEPGEFNQTIQKVLEILKTQTQIDAVGIRFQENGDYPYFVQEGFSDEFLSGENSLLNYSLDGNLCLNEDGKPSLECTCGLVIANKLDPNASYSTKGGSFWTNDALPFLDIPKENDPRINPRNTCIHSGYSSIALIPIKTTSNKIVGLIQLNDKKRERFSLAAIEALEEVARNIGTSLLRKQTNKEMHKINSVLRSVLESTTDGILVVGDDKKIISYSKSFVDLWKIPMDIIETHQDNLLLQYVLDQLVNPEEFLNRVNALYSSDELASDEVNFKDGRVFDRFSQPYFIDEKIKGRVWSFRDITKRVTAIKERNRLTKMLLDSLPCVAILVNSNTRNILAMNNAAEKAGCVIGETCYGSWPKLESPCSFCLAPEACETCENKHVIREEDNKTWDIHWLPVTKELVVHYAMDITDIVRAENVLKKAKYSIISELDSMIEKKVLVVDKDPNCIDEIKAIVGEHLPELIIVSSLSGKDGVMIARKETPDVILLNIKMMEADGVNVCETIKADPTIKDIPIIFLVDYNVGELRRLKALKSGGDAFLSIPIKKEELVSQIQNMTKVKLINKLRLDI